MSRGPIIAIDGPAGAGKSTVARHLAQRFGLLNLETGAMYRAFALRAILADEDFDDPAALERLAGETAITLEPGRAGNRVYLDGVDVTERIRDSDVTQGASRVSVHPAIRKWMVDLQRAMGSEGGVVMEGRDIGTVVFPHADVKIYLDASAEERARRRATDTAHSGSQAGQAAVAAAIQARDTADTTRSVSPLSIAPDAVHIDTTDMPIEQVVRRVMDLVTQITQARG